MSRVVQVANFVAPSSGGLRTALDALADGYAQAGHEVVQVLPGPRSEVVRRGTVTRVVLPAPALPGTGYRLLLDRRAVVRALEQAAPDRLEVHDRSTLRWTGHWAAAAGVPSLVVSHERLDRLLAQHLSTRLPLQRLAAWHNTGLATGFDGVVCTTAWAAAEFEGLAGAPLWCIPLGVDLGLFSPARAVREVEDDVLLLVTATRLSPEKRPDLAVGALAELVRRGHRARLVVAGDGPLRRSLVTAAAGLPVDLVGFVPGREALAGLLGGADVVLAPGPVETFGLAALEALACGTAPVVNTHSALPEVVGDAGERSASTPRSFADAVERLLERDLAERRWRSRSRAERYPWSATVEGFLRAHRLPLASGARQPAGV